MRFRNPAWPRLFGWMLLLAVALVSLGACTIYGEHPAHSYADATGGESLERVFWKNVAAGNWHDVQRALASNYVGLTPGGTVDRTAALEQYRQWGVKDCSLGDLKTELNGNTVVVTYTITWNGTGANPPAGSRHMMTVWQQQKTGWVIIAENVGGQNHGVQNQNQP